jgi:Uri superfamily endonuclease
VKQSALLLRLSDGDIPPLAGSYALWLYLSQDCRLTAGRLGDFDFSSGDYLYLGSARGPGGLQARLSRHLHGPSIPHWHIDALRGVAQVKGYCFCCSTLPHLECVWSQALAVLPGAFIPAAGFGASDCRSICQAHLIGFHPPGLTLDLPAYLANVAGLPVESLRCAVKSGAS